LYRLSKTVSFVLLLQFQEGLTYMEWTYPLTGLDLSVVWDPELWLQFKQAVVWNSPDIFWNKLWDRISYSE
jgi:cell division protease FtsH